MERTLFLSSSTPLRLLRNDTSEYTPISVLEEPMLFYQPPYSSMLTDDLAWYFTRFLADNAGIQDQARVQTPYAEYTVDFLIELGKHRVGFMVGHMGDDNARAESSFRDAMLIDSGGLDVIYRFRAQDLEERLYDCLQLVCTWNPSLFSYRGRVNLETLSSVEARAFKPTYNESLFQVAVGTASSADSFMDEYFVWPSQEARSTEVFFRRMCRQYPAAWLYEYERALVHYGVSPEMLRQKWAKSA
ncbi:MAG: hypothetical protein KTR29_22805 [Rhodothermaceae bacterium]|nr:hypothetical protein [Rhodothermaceae bacterium]